MIYTVKVSYIMTKEDADNAKEEPKPAEPESQPASSSGDQPPKPPAVPKPLLAIEGPKSWSAGMAYAAALNRLAGGKRLKDGTVETSYCSTSPQHASGPPSVHPPKHPSVPPSGPPAAPPIAKPPTMPPTPISKAAAKAAVTPALFTNICMYACIDNIFRQNNINISRPECQ